MENLIAEANVANGTFIQRPMTEEEIAADAAHRTEVAALKEIEDKAKEKAAKARADLLERLGITEDEAKLLLS